MVQILNGTLIPVGSCHRNIIRQCAKHMFNQLHTSEILPYLHCKGVINNHDRQEILQTERTESTSIAALELLVMLPNRNKKWFKYFVEALVKSRHEDLAKIVKEITNNMPETSNLNKPFLCKSSSDDNDTSETNHTVKSLTQDYKSVSGASDKKSRTSLPDKIHSPTFVSCDHQLRVQASQLDRWLNLLDNKDYVNAFETPGNNIIGCSSAGLNQTNIYTGEKVPPEIPTHSLGKSSSNDDNTCKINGAAMSLTNELKSITRSFENQNRPSLPDRSRVSSPISVSSDDQSCVQSSLLDREFDLFEPMTDNTDWLDASETPRNDLLNSTGIIGTEKISSYKSSSLTSDNQSKSSLLDKTSLPLSGSSDECAGKASENQSRSSLSDKTSSPSSESSNKSASKTPDNQSKSAIPDKTSSPSSESNDKSPCKISDNKSKSALPDKTSSPSSTSSDKSTSKTSDNQSKSALPDETSSPSSTSCDKSASKTPDNQSKSTLPDKTSSPSSASSDKSAGKTPDNQSKSALPDKTSSSASSDKSASKTPDNQSMSALPDKTSSSSSASSDKSMSKTQDNQNRSALPDKTSSPSSASSDKSASKTPDNQSMSALPDKTLSPSSASSDKSASKNTRKSE